MSEVRETGAGKAPPRANPRRNEGRKMLLADSVIRILLELVESKLGALTLISAGDRRRLRDLQRCRDELKSALRQTLETERAPELL